jgi:membrane peptidoglycan carboxypeptidase
MARPRPAGGQGSLGRIGLFVAVSVLAGVLAAGLALPLAGSVGVAARSAVSDFEALPSVLKTPPLPQQSQILASDGSVLATFFSENRVVVPLSQVSPAMRQATVAIEDSRFYEHRGFDLRGTLRALATNTSTGDVQQGGSTLTQQYVKNLLLTEATTDEDRAAARARTVARKLQEVRYAIGLEKRYSKDQILEGYLNVSYFGAGAYGVEAAARRYFSTSAADLDLVRSATLAGILQQPGAFDPLRNPALSQERRDVVLRRMAEVGFIAQADADAALAIPIAATLAPSATPNGCSTSPAPFFCDYVVNTVRTDPVFGATADDREALLNRGGLTIRTTLDRVAQAGAQAAVERRIPVDDPSGKAAALAMVEPGTGAIKAMAQNRRWGTEGAGATTYNYAVDRELGGTIGMQAGSTFKVFTLAAALEKGFSLRERISAPAVKTFTGYKNCQTGVSYPPYTVKNSTGSGSFDMATGTALSVNTYFVELQERTGQCRPAEIAEALGVTTGKGTPLERVPSFTLGSQTVSPLSMAEAYATFAARGLHCDARAIVSISDREGKQLPVPGGSCSQVLDRAVADGVTKLLVGVIDGPVRGRTGEAMSLGRPAAGKTGTTNGNAAVWFVGFTPDLAAAVWVGDPRGGTRYPLTNVVINGTYYKNVFGGTLPGPIWKEAMTTALASLPPSEFAGLDPRRIKGLDVEVPNLFGESPEVASSRLSELGLVAQLELFPAASAAPAGTVAYTSPGGGAFVASGDVIQVYLSDGSRVPTPTPTPLPTDPATAVPAPLTTTAPTPAPAPAPAPAPRPGNGTPPPR